VIVNGRSAPSPEAEAALAEGSATTAALRAVVRVAEGCEPFAEPPAGACDGAVLRCATAVAVGVLVCPRPKAA